MAKPGRKTKYTPETVAKIVQAIKTGATYELAANFAGIGKTSFYDWLDKYPEFANAVKEAEGAGAIELLARIRKEAAEGTWQAAAWILERRYPEMYGRQRQEVTGADGGDIVVKVIRGNQNTSE